MMRGMEQRQGLVEPSTSPWIASVILARKKDFVSVSNTDGLTL